jgi:hypothetical protein
MEKLLIAVGKICVTGAFLLAVSPLLIKAQLLRMTSGAGRHTQP